MSYLNGADVVDDGDLVDDVDLDAGAIVEPSLFMPRGFFGSETGNV
jgi:hypothetical protein